jgi:imidazolonepropionase-like amidohydrolase
MDFPADWLPGASLTLSAVPAPHTDETRNGSYLHYSKRLATLLVLGAVSAAQMPVAMAQDILIQNVTLISPERAAPMFHADVLLQEGRIAQIGTKLVPGPHSRPIDGSGRFLIPGLIDSHVHAGHSAALDDDAIDAHPELWAAYRDQLPRAFLAFGFTSVVDLDLKPSDKAWFDGAPVHPHLYSCGKGIKVAGGYMAFKVPAALSENFPNLIYEPKEATYWPKSLNPDDYTAERAISRAADAGAICVKVFVESGFGRFNWPYVHTETLQKIRAAASKRKLVLMVHATSVDSWRSAVDAHADIIAHGLWVWPGDVGNPTPPAAADAVIAAVARAGTRVQPTLQTVAGERAMFDPALLDDSRLTFALPKAVITYLRSPEGVKSSSALLAEYRKASPSPGFEPLLAATVERTHATLNVMLRDHVALIFGSDTPGVDGFGNPPGLNGRLDLQNWADAGVPLPLILRAATLDNAKALRLSHEVGSIQVGKRADLLLLKHNPLESISAYDSIETIFLNGEPVAREALRAHD